MKSNNMIKSAKRFGEESDEETSKTLSETAGLVISCVNVCLVFLMW